jgi:predicted nucleotidyltransferase
MARRLSEKDADALREFVAAVRDALGPNLVELRLFGSKARGDDAPDSDIDVMVVVETDTPDIKNQVYEIAFQIGLTNDVYISPRVVAQAVLQHPVWRITPFLKAVAREGIVL